jgi:hypothetical protein
MKIKDDIILIELRSFKRSLNTYIGSIADSDLNNKLTNGACNRLRRLYKPNIESFTVEALQQFVKLYDSLKSTAIRTYNKKSRSRPIMKNNFVSGLDDPTTPDHKKKSRSVTAKTRPKTRPKTRSKTRSKTGSIGSNKTV